MTIPKVKRRLPIVSLSVRYTILAASSHEECQGLQTNQLNGDTFQLFFRNSWGKALLYYLIARISGDIAGNEFAAHTYGLAWNSIFLGLLLRYLLEALVEEILFELFYMLTKLTTKAIVGIAGWALLVKTHHAERTAIEQIEAAIHV